jgi:hypothetical protein
MPVCIFSHLHFLREEASKRKKKGNVKKGKNGRRKIKAKHRERERN